MPKPVWAQKLQAKLDACPLYFIGADFNPTCQGCLTPSEKVGKLRKLTLRQVVNYSGWNVCQRCKKAYR